MTADGFASNLGSGEEEYAAGEHTAEKDAPAQVEPCKHFYSWMSPAGARKSARICMGCGWPDPEWLNHITEVDRGHGSGCVHCEFADTNVTPPGEGRA